ncbi:MAG: YfhO family protein [Clostridiales bacterium]|nr:YfhO family protein [Clostridiales bacterium]
MKEISSLDGGSARKTASGPSPKPSLKNNNKTDLHPLYAFLSTLVLFILVLVVFKKYPFGDDSFLLSDLEAQYAPFLALMRSKITELGSVPADRLISYLSYSFKLGLGKSIASTVGYYLASPFNLVYLFFDVSQIDAVIVMIIVSKLSLASGFMCLFLGKRFDDRKTIWPVVLGIMYAFTTYSRFFVFNIMWLDGYMLLPLILYFTEKFIEKRRYSGLIISLLVLFVSNYYIAYMAGIACFLYLCIRMFELETPLKKAAGICVRYVLTAGFTGMMTAVMLVPVGLDTIRNGEQTISPRSDLLITYSPLTLIHMLLLGEPREFDLLAGNYPFIFISLSVTILVMIYFFSPVFKGREKKVHAFCGLGVLLSTAVIVIDTAWQVCDEPNWFWHRQAFVFLPLFLIISYRVLVRLKDIARKDILKVMLIMFLLVTIDYSIGVIKAKADIFSYNMVLIAVYSAIFAGYSKEKWPDQLRDMPRMLSPLLVGVICFEVAFAGPMMTSGVNIFTLRKGSAKEYADSIKAEEEFGDYAEKNNAGLDAFRAETVKIPDYTIEHYVEDGEAIYGDYNGISLFNSCSNKKMHHFMKQLGYATNYNYFAVWHRYTCPPADSFFSVGSLSAREDWDLYRLDGEDTAGTGLKFYSNSSAMPLAFAADKGAYDFDFYRLERDVDEKDYFALQNDWYGSLFPEQFTEDFFNVIGEDVTGEPRIFNGAAFNSSEYVTHRYLESKSRQSDSTENTESVLGSGTGATLGSGSDALLGRDPIGLERTVQNELKEKLTNLYRTNEEVPIIIEYDFKAPSDDDIYCTLVTGRILDGCDIYVNGEKVYGFTSGKYYSVMLRLGSFKEGDDVKVTIWSEEDKWSYLNIRFASFDDEAFSAQMVGVNRTKVHADSVSDGYAKFSVSDLDSDEMVLTTIPAEDGWQLYIDGAPAEYRAYQDAFISFDVPSGDHTAELVFTAPGLKAGACISCVGVVLLAAFVIIDKSRSKKAEKQK